MTRDTRLSGATAVMPEPESKSRQAAVRRGPAWGLQGESSEFIFSGQETPEFHWLGYGEQGPIMDKSALWWDFVVRILNLRHRTSKSDSGDKAGVGPPTVSSSAQSVFL